MTRSGLQAAMAGEISGPPGRRNRSAADARQAQLRPARPKPTPQGLIVALSPPNRKTASPVCSRGVTPPAARCQPHEIGPQDALNLVPDRIRHRAVPSLETGFRSAATSHRRCRRPPPRQEAAPFLNFSYRLPAASPGVDRFWRNRQCRRGSRGRQHLSGSPDRNGRSGPARRQARRNRVRNIVRRLKAGQTAQNCPSCRGIVVGRRRRDRAEGIRIGVAVRGRTRIDRMGTNSLALAKRRGYPCNRPRAESVETGSIRR